MRAHRGPRTQAGEGAAPNGNLATPPSLKPHLRVAHSALHRLKQQPPLAAAVVVGRELARDAAVQALHVHVSFFL